MVWGGTAPSRKQCEQVPIVGYTREPEEEQSLIYAIQMHGTADLCS